MRCQNLWGNHGGGGGGLVEVIGARLSAHLFWDLVLLVGDLTLVNGADSAGSDLSV